MAQSLQIQVEINLKTKKEDFDKLTSKLENKGIAVKLTVTNEELKNFRETIQKKFSNKNNSVSIGLTVKTTTVRELRKEIQRCREHHMKMEAVNGSDATMKQSLLHMLFPPDQDFFSLERNPASTVILGSGFQKCEANFCCFKRLNFRSFVRVDRGK